MNTILQPLSPLSCQTITRIKFWSDLQFLLFQPVIQDSCSDVHTNANMDALWRRGSHAHASAHIYETRAGHGWDMYKYILFIYLFIFRFLSIYSFSRLSFCFSKFFFSLTLAVLSLRTCVLSLLLDAVFTPVVLSRI